MVLSLTANLVTSSMALWRGTAIAVENPVVPEQPLHLYDMEGCPFCRLVREVLTELDLDAVIYPCPKGGDRFRNRAMEIGGKTQFPLLVDPNRQVALYESRAIVEYLYEHYGPGKAAARRRIGTRQTLRAMIASASRLGGGSFARPSHRPERLLELYSFESSPYSRPVRELLCELEIAYVVRNCGKGSKEDYLLPVVRERFYSGYQPVTRNRKTLLAQTGRVAVPYLVDPNENRALYESRAILDYLKQQYQI